MKLNVKRERKKERKKMKTETDYKWNANIMAIKCIKV